jgi:L-fuconolactonase
VIVDAQVHLWDEDRPDRPWPPDTSSHGHRRITTGDELVAELDAAGVDRAVLVPPSWEGERNDLVLAAARAHPDRFIAMGRIGSDTDPAAIATWTDDPQMAGIRITCHRGPQRALLTSDAGDWLWRAAEAAGVPIMMYAPYLHADVERLVTRFPNLRLAIDHVNLGLDIVPETLAAAIEPTLALARFPNVSVKASGLECHSAGPERLALIGGVVERLVAAFGAERVFWGTDLTRIPLPYRDAVATFAEGIALGEQERALVMGEAILRWLPWPA